MGTIVLAGEYLSFTIRMSTKVCAGRAPGHTPQLVTKSLLMVIIDASALVRSHANSFMFTTGGPQLIMRDDGFFGKFDTILTNPNPNFAQLPALVATDDAWETVRV